jgi:thioredoxin reductase
MTTIYKYQLEIVDEQTLELPYDSTFIHVGLDPNGLPCIWATVDTEQQGRSVKTIFIVGTGRPIPDAAFFYLNSFNQGQFVWHVFHS